MIRDTDGGVLIEVRVQPKASRTKHAFEGGRLKVWVNAPPVDGKANRALVEYMAKILKVRKGAVSIVKVESSRDTVLLVEGLSADDVRERLGC